MDDDVVKKGTLQKWANYISGWQDRYFVLRGDTLFYYKSRRDVDAGCRGSMAMPAATINHSSPTEMILTASHAVYHLRSQSEGELTGWLSSLERSKWKKNPILKHAPVAKQIVPSSSSTCVVKTKITPSRIHRHEERLRLSSIMKKEKLRNSDGSDSSTVSYSDSPTTTRAHVDDHKHKHNHERNYPTIEINDEGADDDSDSELNFGLKKSGSSLSLASTFSNASEWSVAPEGDYQDFLDSSKSGAATTTTTLDTSLQGLMLAAKKFDSISTKYTSICNTNLIGLELEDEMQQDVFVEQIRATNKTIYELTHKFISLALVHNHDFKTAREIQHRNFRSSIKQTEGMRHSVEKTKRLIEVNQGTTERDVFATPRGHRSHPDNTTTTTSSSSRATATRTTSHLPSSSSSSSSTTTTNNTHTTTAADASHCKRGTTQRTADRATDATTPRTTTRTTPRTTDQHWALTLATPQSSTSRRSSSQRQSQSPQSSSTTSDGKENELSKNLFANKFDMILRNPNVSLPNRLSVSNAKGHRRSYSDPLSSDASRCIDAIDQKLAADEMVIIHENEQKIRDRIKTKLGDKFNLLSKKDVVQIIRGHIAEKDPLKAAITAAEKIAVWRQEVNFSTLIDTKLQHAKKFHSIWNETVYGEDCFGHPLVGIRVAEVDADKMATIPQSQLLRLVAQKLALYGEYMEHLSNKSHIQRYKLSYLIDMSGAGVTTLLGEKKALMQRIFGIGANYFPESVWKIYVVNAPFALRMGWSVVKSLIHPITEAKIKIIGSNSEAQARLLKDGFQLNAVPVEFNGSNPGIICWELLQLVQERESEYE